MKTICLSALLFILTGTAYAEEVTKYVSDQLVITMRSGAGNQYKITNTLKTGTALTILEVSEDQKYSLVRTPNGTEGWVLNQYLMPKPAAQTLLAELNSQHNRLQKAYDDLKKRFDQLEKESSATSKARNQLDSERGKLEKELENLRKVAAKPIQLEEENRQVKEELIALKNNLRIAEEKSAALEDSHDQQWFAVGAGVLILGMIMGLLIPKVRGRKRGLWNEL